MRRWLLACWFGLAGLASAPAWALSPYVHADPVACHGLTECAAAAQAKLAAAGFELLGTHYPRDVGPYAVLVVTDKAWLRTIRALGGSAIVGAGIRVGVKGDGSVTYINPDYWYRAYFQNRFESQHGAVTALARRLTQSLGHRGVFGGDVPATDLPNYRFMIGMEGFDSDKAKLFSHPSFAAALTAVRQNLAKGLNHTSQVYEVVMPAQRIAVFGVAMNGVASGEHVWVKRNGPEHIAALPWEIFIVDGQVYALYARYRTALAWPALGLGEFMRIADHPDTVQAMLTAVAGGRNLRLNDF